MSRPRIGPRRLSRPADELSADELSADELSADEWSADLLAGGVQVQVSSLLRNLENIVYISPRNITQQSAAKTRGSEIAGFDFQAQIFPFEPRHGLWKAGLALNAEHLFSER